MNREFKGYGSVVTINGDSIFVKYKFGKDMNITINSITSIDWIDPTALANGSIKLNTKDTVCQFFFLKKQVNDFKEMYDYLTNIVSAETGLDISLLANKRLGVISGIEYKGGHPLIVKEGKINIEIYESKIILERLLLKQEISFKDIINVSYETQEQMSSRFTATRLALLGPFALAFKKKKKTTEKFLTIDFKDNHEMELTIVFAGPNTSNAYSTIYRVLSIYKDNQIEDKPVDNQATTSSSDPYEEVKKLKELLDMGIINQEEFDKKKTELLGL